MCLACEMTAWWFADMAQAERPDLGAPDRAARNEEPATAADGGRNSTEGQQIADGAAHRNAPRQAFTCEPAGPE